MRTAQDINTNQCDKCGKIQREGELTNIEGEACCNDCVIEWENLNND